MKKEIDQERVRCSRDSIHSFKSCLIYKKHHRKVILRSCHLNGHAVGFSLNNFAEQNKQYHRTSFSTAFI